MSEEVEEEDVLEAPAPVAVREAVNWKTKAIRLYESRQVAREQSHKVMLEKQIFQFREGVSQLLGKEYDINGLRAEIEGVTFICHGGGTPGSTAETHVEFKCKDCGGVQHQLVRGLADIGGILSGAGEPHENCPARARSADASVELSAGEKLIEALRNFLASELEQVE